MEPYQVIPQAPSAVQQVAFCSFEGNLYIAYASGSRVMICLAHTFMVLQKLEGHTGIVNCVAWAPSYGRLASAAENIIVWAQEKGSNWKAACTITQEVCTSLSWSFYGDALCTAAVYVKVWRVQFDKRNPTFANPTCFWQSEGQAEKAEISPDGRLVASLHQGHISIWYRSSPIDQFTESIPQDALQRIRLKTSVSWLKWHDLSASSLRVRQYNPNVILAVTKDSKLQVWTEYCNPKGLGFSIVFTMQFDKPQVSWLHNFSKTDGISSPDSSSKFEVSRLFEVRDGMPEHSAFGMLSKTPPPVDWFVVVEGERLIVFQCEGLGSYPYTAVTISERLQTDAFWPEFGTRWRTQKGFLIAVREEQELLLFGQDSMLDFVRWRRAFVKAMQDTLEGEGMVSMLTSVFGAHRADIISIDSHMHEPIVASLDAQGAIRIWSTSSGVRHEKRAVDCLRHWGAIEDCKGKAIKWLPTFAVLAVATTERSIRLYKWKSDSVSHLKLPTMHWVVAVEWVCSEGSVQQLEVSKLSIDVTGEFSFILACLHETSYSLWSVSWNGESFCFEPLVSVVETALQLSLVSKMIASEENSEEEAEHSLIVLTQSRIALVKVAGTQLETAWSISLARGLRSMEVSDRICLIQDNKVDLISLQGFPQGSLNCRQQPMVKFISEGQVTENLIILEGKLIQVLAQEFQSGIGQQNLTWKLCFEANLSLAPSCVTVTNRHQVVAACGAELLVYLTYVDSENLFHFISKFQQPRPLYHPLSLIELIVTNKKHIVDTTLTSLCSAFEQGKISRRLGISIENLFEEPKQAPIKAKSDADELDWLFGGSSSSSVPKVAETMPSLLTSSQLRQLKEQLGGLSHELPGVSENLMWLRQLMVVIDTYYSIQQQARSLDEFASIFYLYVKLHKFAIENRQPLKGLSSREVAWALHSDQQDTLFSLCFNESLDWPTMRRYGMGIWVQQLSRIRQMIEALAKSEYMKSRKAESVFLWYVALNKKTVLQGLYKAEPQNSRVWEFLSRDFSEERWQIAAQKNAFELRIKRRFEMSAGFFLLAGDLRKAVDVLAADQNDTQQAIVVSRLVEGGVGPVTVYAVEKYLLQPAKEAGDPWMASIASTLLGRHASSVRELYDYKDFSSTEDKLPSPSPLHPSLLYFATLLKNTIKVKRELNGEVIQPPYQLLLASGSAYLNSGMPTLALLALTKDVRQVDRSLTERAVKTHLMIVLADTSDDELAQSFPSLCHEIDFLSAEYGVPAKNLQNFISEIFHKRDLRRHQCAFMRAVGNPKAAEPVLHLAATLHVIMSRFSRNPDFDINLSPLIDITTELKHCLEQLGYERDLDTIQRRGCLMQITLSIFLGVFIIQYITGDWEKLMITLQLLQDYLRGPNKYAYKKLDCTSGSPPVKADFTITWLRFLCVSKLKSLLRSFDFTEVDEWMEESLMRYNRMESKRNSSVFLKSKTMYFKLARSSLGPGRGIKKRPLMTVQRLKRRCESWQMRLLMKVGKLNSQETVKDTEHWIDVFMKSSHSLQPELTAHFANASGYNVWNTYFEGQLKLHHLVKTSVPRLAINPKSSTLLGTGLEIFKSKSSVVGFAVNQCDMRSMAIAVNPCKHDGILEVNIETSLKFRQRNANMQLVDENPDNWRENVHFIPHADSFDFRFNPTLNFALQTLYPDTSQQFNENLSLPPANWHRVPLPRLLESLSGHKERSEEATKIAGHPMLPLYVTGNKSGRLTLWEYSRATSLQDFGIVSSREKVTCVNFNAYGDKLGVCDSIGNFFLYKFDLQPTSFQPQLSILASLGSQTSAFTFLNAGSVVATVGYKPKPFLTIYDTLLPARQSSVFSTDCGGTTLHFLANNSHLCIGDRKGRLIDFDLRRLDVIRKHNTNHDMIKDIISDVHELNLVTGGADGTVKLWDASTLEHRETIAVVDPKKSRGSVTKLGFVGSALFVGTSCGNVKLLRSSAF